MRPEDLLQKASRLPSVPKVAAQLLASLESEDTTAADIVRIVMADQALSAKILQLANSAFYKKARTIATVQDAAVLLGTTALRTLVIGVGVAANLPFPPGFDERLFWRYNLHAAVAAKFLAPAVHLDPDVAFSAGLLHTIGEPIIGLALPDAARQLDRQWAFFERGRAQAERRLLGLDYAEIGGYLAESWNLPPDLVGALRHCAEPEAVQPFPALAGLVRLAADLAVCHELDLPVGEALAGPTGRLLAQLRLTPQTVQGMPPVRKLAEGLELFVR
ncbi:MAG: HDOD domain-containing protein [Gammaproteobacteria bacterium]|nr:HDOD domain-containing protein [Gammaproteobacteria bacterium]